MDKTKIEQAADALARDIIARAEVVLLQKPELTRTKALEMVIEMMVMDIDDRSIT